MTRRQANGNTHDRLLEAAGRLFAQKGFAGATVAEICAAAEANIAAVNYHFGGKENLYREAWKYAHRQSMEAFSPDGGAAMDAPAEARLAGRIRAMLQRRLVGEGLEYRIMDHEVAHPTGLLEQVFHDTIRPLSAGMEDIIRQLLGEGFAAESQTVRFCVMSVIGPCLQATVSPKVRSAAERRRPALDEIEPMVDHFTAFALAGIEGIKQARRSQAAMKIGKGVRT